MDLCLIKKAIIYTTFFKKLLCMCDCFCTFALLFEKSGNIFCRNKTNKRRSVLLRSNDVQICLFLALSVFFFALFESSSKNL